MSFPTGWQSWISDFSLGKSTRTPTRLRGANSSSAPKGQASYPVWGKRQPGKRLRKLSSLAWASGLLRDEAWAALKDLKKGTKDIVELAGEAEKLAKRLHPRDEEAAERHAMHAFLGALDKNLAMEVQKLGHRTMEEVVAAARRIEKILEEQTDSNMERLVNSMHDQIRILKKDLKEAHEQIATHKDAAPPTSGHGRYSRTCHSSYCCRPSPTYRTCMPHLPRLQRRDELPPPSPLSTRPLPTTLLPLR